LSPCNQARHILKHFGLAQLEAYSTIAIVSVPHQDNYIVLTILHIALVNCSFIWAVVFSPDFATFSEVLWCFHAKNLLIAASNDLYISRKKTIDSF
jgi:hypothetical protein